MPKPVPLLVHEEDPADEIFKLAGNLEDIDVFNHNVLVGVYGRGGKQTAGGIILTHQTTDEDDYQSKVGVILKMGPTAFQDPNGKWFKDEEFSVGDWVVYRPSNGYSIQLISKGSTRSQAVQQLCRILDDTSVLMRIDGPMGPDRVY